MAAQDVQQIIGAIQGLLAHKQSQQQLAIQQHREASEAQYREEEAQHAKDVLEEQKRQHKAELDQRATQFDVQQKLAKALHDAQIAREEQDIGVKAAQTGIVPSTVSAQPAATGNSGFGMSPVNPQAATSQLLTMPSGNQMQVLNPTEYAKQQAEITRITSKPAEEAKTREAQALQDAETARQLKVGEQTHAARLAEIAEQHRLQMLQQQNQQAAALALQNSRAASEFLLKSAELTGDPSYLQTGTRFGSDDGQPTFGKINPGQVANNAIDDLRFARVSQEDFLKKYGKQGPYYLKLANQAGLGTLNKDQYASLNDLETTAQAAPIIRDMISLRAQNPTKVLVPGTDAYKQFQADEQTLSGKIPAISRTLSGVKRFNQAEFKLYMDSLIPGRNPLTSNTDAAIKKYNTFVTDDLQSAFNTVTRSLPPNHQAILRDTLGLNNLPFLNSAIKTPGQEPPTPTGATPAAKVKVRRKSDGQIGLKSPDKIDPNIYEIVKE